MPELDLSFTVAAIIAVCALVSPIATALVNNHHQIRMKRLEYEHMEKMAQAAREQEIFEGYVQAAGACVQVHNTEALQAFGSHSSLAMYHVPDDIRADMLLLEKTIRSDDKVSKIELLARITVRLRQLRKTT